MSARAKPVWIGTALMLALVLPASTAGAAKHPGKRTICRAGTALRYSPAGAEIGRLAKGDRVIVVDYARHGRWAYVVSRNGSGWIVTRALCR